MARPEPVPPCVHKTPARKIALRDALYDLVYERTIERFNETLTDIRAKNRVAMGYTWDGFTHRGVYYGQPIGKVPHPEQPMTVVALAKYKAQMHMHLLALQNQKLDASLAPALDLLIAEREEIEKVEGVLVRSTLGSILNCSKAVSDYIALLPSLLHPHLMQVLGECSCTVPYLSTAELQQIKAKHKHYIGLIQRRQLIYLLVP